MLDQFLRFFKATTSWSMPEEIFGGQAALRNHKDLLDIVRLLKYRPNDTRAILAEEHFASYGDAQPESIDQHRAFNLAVRVMTMVQCSVESSSRVPWRGGYKPVVWHDDESLRTLMESAFRRKDPPSLGDVHEFSIKSRLAAKTLKTVHGLKFQGTNDLRRHLLLDPETKTIHIFHYNSLLKEHLLETKDRGSGNRYVYASF
jgi:hypothetical protein